MARRPPRRPPAPRAGRPMMPKTYGVKGRRDALLPWTWARRRLAGAHNYSTARRSRKGRNLRRRPNAVVHLESGDRTVILEGRVREVRDRAVLERYAALYHAKYRFRPEAAGPANITYALLARVGFAW